MSKPNVPVKRANAARTAIQAGPAWVVVENIDAFVYDLSDRQFGALVALLLIVFSYVQVVIENYAGRALLRNPYVQDVPTTAEIKPRITGGTTPQS